MKASEFRKLIREEVKNVMKEAEPKGIDLWAKGSDYNQMRRTIGDILADGRRPDIPTYIWTSIRTLKSRNWGEIGKAQVSKFEPLLKKMQNYESITVGDFFGEKTFKKLKRLEQVLQGLNLKGDESTKEDYLKAFDEIYKIVSQTLASKLNEATVKLGRAKNLKLKSDKNGVDITRTDYNDGRISSQIYIFKDEIPDIIAFLNKMK